MKSPAQDRLSPNDTAFFVSESEVTPQVTALVTLLDRTPSLEVLRAAALRGTNALERMRSIPDTRRFGVLIPAQIAIERHVVQVYAPEIAHRERLLDRVARLHSQPLDRSRPLWEIVLLTNRNPATGELPGESPEQAAILWRIHHGLTDGIRALHTFWAMLGQGMPLGMVDTLPNGRASHSGDFFARASRAVHVVSRINSMKTIPSPLKGKNSAARRLTLVELDRNALRGIMRAHGACLHDVVVSLLAAALRRYHEHHGASTKTDLRVIVPGNSRPLPDAGSHGNFVDMLWLPLPIAEPDPRKRLSRVSAALRQARDEGWEDFSRMTPHLIARMPVWIQRRSFTRACALTTVVCTILPGSIHRLSVDGQSMARSYAAATLLETHGAGFTFLTAGPVLRGAIISDPAIVPDPQLLGSALEDALQELMGRKLPADATPSRSVFGAERGT